MKNKPKQHTEMITELCHQYKNANRFAKRLCLTRTTVAAWQSGLRRVPPLQAYIIERITMGKYKFIDFYPEVLDIIASGY